MVDGSSQVSALFGIGKLIMGFWLISEFTVINILQMIMLYDFILNGAIDNAVHYILDIIETLSSKSSVLCNRAKILNKFFCLKQL